MAVISEVITDKVIISFDTLSPPTVENVNDESYFRIKGTIDNYQDLVDAHGNLENFYRYSFENHLDDYSVILDSGKLVNGAISNENFDISIKIPDYFPNGNYDSISALVNFTNSSQLPVEFPSQMPDLIYTGRTGSDSQDPILIIDSVPSGDNDYTSLIVSGNAFDTGVKSNQFQVNGLQVTGDQATPEIAKFPDGHFVVTWRNDPSDINPGGTVGGDTRIFAQILDPSGKRVGDEFQVNTYEGIQERNAVVETLGNDKFVVIWHSTGRDSEVDEDIRGQILDRSGNKIGVEFTLNSTTSNSQNFPDITSYADGGFVATWNSMNQDSSSGSIIARKFDASGNPITDELLVNTYTSGEQTNPEINQLSDGNVVISWMSYGQDGSGVGLYGQIIDQNFQKIGNEFSINTSTNGDQAYHSMASLTNGGFVVVWEDSGPASREEHTLKGQLFDSDGSKNGGEFKVNDAQNVYGFVYDSDYDPDVVGLKDGGFFVTYSGHDNGHGGYGYDVFGQFFDDSGSKIGPEFQVNNLDTEHQNTSSAVEVDGGVLVTFHNYNNQRYLSGDEAYSDLSGHGIAGKFIPNPSNFADLSGAPVIKDIRINDSYGVKGIPNETLSKLEFIFDRPVSVEYKGEPIGSFDAASGDNNEFRDDMRVGHFGINENGSMAFGDKLFFDHAQMTEGGTVLSFQIIPMDYSVAYPEQQRFFIDDIADTSNHVGSQFKVIDLNGNETTLRDLFISNPDLSHVMYDGDYTKPGIRKDDGVDGEKYPTIMEPNNIDYVLFDFSTLDGQASQQIVINKDVINEDGSFSFEYITESAEVNLRGALAIDTNGNETLYANSNFDSDPYFRFNDYDESPNAPEILSTSWDQNGIEILKNFGIDAPIGSIEVKDIDGNDLQYFSKNNALSFVKNNDQKIINIDVTVQAVSGSNKYFMDGIQQSELKLEVGNTYNFDLSQVPSHPFKLSSTENGKWNGGVEFLDGVTKNGNILSIVVQEGTPDLYYYCDDHSGMGSSALVETIDKVDIFIKEGSTLSQLEDLITNVTTLDLSVTDGSNYTDQNFDLKVYDFVEGYSSIVYTTENGANGYVSGTANGFNLLTGNQISANTYNVVDENNHLQLSAADDFLTVNAQNLIVNAGLGNDTITNFHSSNIINGGLGNDTLVGFGDVASDLRGNAGNDKITGSEGNDTISTGADNDVVSAGAGDDLIIAGSGRNLIFGGDGIDTIRNDVEGFNEDTNFQLWGAKWKYSGLGDNTIFGVENVITGNGNDTIGATGDDNTFQTGYGNDFILAGDGVDTFVFEDDGTDIDVNLFSWGEQNTGQGIDKFWGVENAVTFDGNDRISGTDADNLIKSGLGNDFINFGSGNDTFQFSGNDNYTINLFTNLQQDTGEGLDTFISVENVISGSGNDRLSGSDGDNIFDPGHGDDFINAGAGNDTVKFSGIEAVNVDLGYGWYQNTGYGRDLFWSVENVISSSGNDFIKGSSKQNVLEGGSGNDLIWGKEDDDTFVFKSNFGEDVIKDFEIGDIIDLTGILGANYEEVSASANQKKISVFDGSNEYQGSITLEFYDGNEIGVENLNFLYESI